MYEGEKNLSQKEIAYGFFCVLLVIFLVVFDFVLSSQFH